MYVPVKRFNAEQKLWFGRLLVEAIKSDGVVDQIEMNYLLSILQFLSPEQKTQVTQILKMKGTLPGLQNIPEGLTQEDLGNVYSQLVLVIVSDSKFTVAEHAFLDRVRSWFNFPPEIETSFVNWTDQMLVTTKVRQGIQDQLSK